MERTDRIWAVHQHPAQADSNVVVRRAERFAAPGTVLELYRILPLQGLQRVLSQILQLNFRVFQVVRRRRPSHPHANRNSSSTQISVFVTHTLHRANQNRCTFKLLERQQAQGVTHQHRDPATVCVVSQSAKEHSERDQPQVCLSLAATGRKPQEVSDLPVFMVGVDDAFEAQEHECDLERAPPSDTCVRGTDSPVLNPLASSALLSHSLICQLKSLENLWLLGIRKQRQPATHPRERLSAQRDLFVGHARVVGAGQDIRVADRSSIHDW